MPVRKKDVNTTEVDVTAQELRQLIVQLFPNETIPVGAVMQVSSAKRGGMTVRWVTTTTSNRGLV